MKGTITIPGQQYTYNPSDFFGEFKRGVMSLFTPAVEIHTIAEALTVTNTVFFPTDVLVQQLAQLRLEIGNELYNQLNKDERLLLINTSGKLNIGENANIDRMFKSIENYRTYDE